MSNFVRGYFQVHVYYPQMNQNQLFDKLRQKHNEFCFFSEKNLTLSKIGVPVQCMSVFLSFVLVYVFISSSDNQILTYSHFY